MAPNPVSTLEKIRTVCGDTIARNIKLAPSPLTSETIPVLESGGTLLEIHSEHTNPLPAHHRALLHSDATIAAPDFAFIIGTQSAYHFQLMAKSLMAQLNHLRPISNNLTWVMQTALHELITNAVTHGNLNAGNLMSHNRDNLTALGKMMVTRLKNTEYAHRYITITLKLTPKEAVWHVADDGAGFDVPVTLERIHDDPLRYSGRGIVMAQKLSSYLNFESGGRVATITFPL